MSIFLSGPVVLPGRYQVRLTVGDESWTQPFEILPDPRRHETPEGVRAQHDLLVKINAKLTEANDAVNQIRDLTGQIDAWQKRGKGEERIAQAAASAEAVRKTLRDVEQALFKTEPDTDLHYTATLKLSGRLAALKFAVDFSDYAPTTQATAVYEELAGKVDAQLDRLRQTLQDDLSRLNQQIHDAKLPAIAPRPAVENERGD